MATLVVNPVFGLVAGVIGIRSGDSRTAVTIPAVLGVVLNGLALLPFPFVVWAVWVGIVSMSC